MVASGSSGLGMECDNIDEFFYELLLSASCLTVGRNPLELPCLMTMTNGVQRNQAFPTLLMLTVQA